MNTKQLLGWMGGGAAVATAVALTIAFGVDSNQGVQGAENPAVNPSPVLPPLDLTATPTPAPVPTVQPLVAGSILEEFTNADALAAWEFLEFDEILPEADARANWIVRDQELRQHYVGRALTPSLQQVGAVLTAYEGSDASIGFDLYDTSNGVAGFVARYSDAGHYRIVLLANRYDSTDRLQIVRVTPSGEVVLLSQDWAGFSNYEWLRLGLEITDDTLQVSVDGRILATARDPQPLPAGRFGIYTRAIGGIAFDQFTLAIR